MTRNLSELNTAFDSLLARVNSLDGQNLADPTESVVAQLTREIEGLRETVNQAVLTLAPDFDG